jgi:hypothetical protein
VLADRLAAMEADRLNWQRQQPQKPEPVKVEKPDPLLDPEGYEKYIFTQMEERFLNNQRKPVSPTLTRPTKGNSKRLTRLHRSKSILLLRLGCSSPVTPAKP